MRIITSGSEYIDIDAYGSMVAYAELLNLQGVEAQAVSTAPLNSSITNSLRALPVNLLRTYQPNPTDTFTLVDVSEAEFFEPFVDLDRIDEVIDHHTGFEEFWKQKIGDGAVIEFIGSACTQIYEKWIAADKVSEMSATSAKLLAAGIIDNTLNFLAKVTTDRDKGAYKVLCGIGGLQDDWAKNYFLECETAILVSLEEAIQNDTKVKFLNGYPDKLAIGQLLVWDSKPVLEQFSQVQTTLTGLSEHWFMNLMALSDGRSYFLSSHSGVQEWLQETLNVKFEDTVAVANRLWLRKEIIKAAQALHPSNEA